MRPKKLFWTSDLDTAITTARKEGKTFDAIADLLKVSRTAVIARAKEIGIHDPKRQEVLSSESEDADPDEERPVSGMFDRPIMEPLPAGHPITWGAISNEPWPGWR